MVKGSESLLQTIIYLNISILLVYGNSMPFKPQPLKEKQPKLMTNLKDFDYHGKFDFWDLILLQTHIILIPPDSSCATFITPYFSLSFKPMDN